MRLVRIVRALILTFGWRGLTRRSWHEIRIRLGLYRATPKYHVPFRTSDGARIYAPGDELAGLLAGRIGEVLARGRKVVDGWYEAYGFSWRRLPETPIQWRMHPDTGYLFPNGRWWKIDPLSAAADIKDVWEPGRFGWVYDLIRAYAATKDAIYSEAFHSHLSAWMTANPPYSGVHWACGQEVAIRSLAILHAMDALPLPAQSGRSAHARMLDVLGWSGERIASAIGYGLSQRNNHGISEAAGLIHIGLRLRDLHPEAGAWLRLGQRYLVEQIGDQFSRDGWYAQHSFTYMRVALEQGLLAQRALGHHGMSLPAATLDLLASSLQLLVRVVDGKTGHVPNHGANDGGRVAPLSTAEYRDFRPIITQAAMILDLPLPSDIDPDPEVVGWTRGAAPRLGQPREDGVWVGASGWGAARIGDTAVFLWAGAYRHRPSHLDALHLDVSFHHSEAIVDPGTFAYNAPAPWKNALTSAAVHNGPILDGVEPGERGPRFLWYSWPLARLLRADYRDGHARVLAEVPGRVRREIEVLSGQVRVVDSVLDSSAASMQVTWLIGLHMPTADVVVEDGCAERIAAGEGHVTGWFSPTYGLRLRSTAIRIRALRTGSALGLTTVIRYTP
jgi:hypothetical protein